MSDCCCSPFGPAPTPPAESAFIIRADLADLAARDSAAFPNGVNAYVVAERVVYVLDTANPLTVFSPLIVARGAGAGRWYRNSRAYVVGNYTLWVNSFGVGVVGFTPGQLLASGNPAPDIQLSMPPLASNGPQDVTVDNLGNLWVTANDGVFTSIAIRKYLLKDCLVSGVPPPQVLISPPIPASTECGRSAFDPKNGLWTMNGSHGTFGVSQFVRYGQKSYAAAAGALPETTLVASAAPPSSNQQDLCFDGQGNLWCSIAFTSGPFNGGIIMFTAAQIQAGGGAVAPTVFWTGSNFTGPGLAATVGLSVASNGFLWCANFSGNNIKAWNMVGAASGNPAPDVVLTSASFNQPYTLAFDAAGNLWTQNANNNLLLRIPKASLAASGLVVPDVIINSPVPLGNLAFPNNPDRTGLLPSGSPPGP